MQVPRGEEETRVSSTTSREKGADRKPTECGGTLWPPKGNCTPTTPAEGRNALLTRTTMRRVHTHTCAHFNATSRATNALEVAHKPRTKFTHLNREKHFLNEVKTKDTQLNQSWQEVLLPTPSCTSFLNYDAEPHELLQPRSTKFTRISSAHPQEFTAR